MRHTVLLSLHTPLYAPLYLAKAKGYIRHVDLQYLEFRNLDRLNHGSTSPEIDPLIREVLSPSRRDRDCIAAICDPFRALREPTDNFETPLILGGLIRHMCFYLADASTDIPHSQGPALHEKFERIIVHPPYMTGYAVVAHHLKEVGQCPDLQAAEDNFLYHKVYAGYEYLHYSSFQRRKPRRHPRNYAFLTTNPMYIYDRQSAVNIPWRFADHEPFKNALMTSIVTSRETYERGATSALCDLVDGVSRAIDDIYNDPLAAAYTLRNAESETFTNVMARFDVDDLYKTLLMLATSHAYSRQCEVASSEIAKSINIHLSAASNPELQLLKFDDPEKFFLPKLINSNPREEGYYPKGSIYPDWVKELAGVKIDESPGRNGSRLTNGLPIFWGLVLCGLSAFVTNVWPKIFFDKFGDITDRWSDGATLALKYSAAAAGLAGSALGKYNEMLAQAKDMNRDTWVIGILLAVVGMAITLGRWRAMIRAGRPRPLTCLALCVIAVGGFVLITKDIFGANWVQNAFFMSFSPAALYYCSRHLSGISKMLIGVDKGFRELKTAITIMLDKPPPIRSIP